MKFLKWLIKKNNHIYLASIIIACIVTYGVISQTKELFEVKFGYLVFPFIFICDVILAYIIANRYTDDK